MHQSFHQPAAVFALLAALLTAPIHAQTCPFDNGGSSLEVEGLILTRYALGLTGAPLVANTSINAVDAPTVEASINCPSCGLNITGNPTMTVADATIISRKLAGFSGAALTDNLALGSGTRNTPAAVQSFLLAGCGATGGTVTSITAGTGLTGGTITGSGTIAADTTFLQRRVSSTCTANSFITAVAADGTVTCATPATGGGGTVTSITAGTGLTGGTITGSGTVAVNTAVIQSRVSATCAAGSSIRAIAADGTVTCQTDTTGGSGTVTSINTGAGLTGGPITAAGTINLTANQLLPTAACATNQIAKWSGSAWICAADDAGPANAFVQGGNTFSALGAGVASVLGNNDNRPLTVQAPQSTIKLLVDPANGDDGLRISYATDPGFGPTPNTINGSRANSVAAGVYGATIAGGGAANGPFFRNSVTGNFGTVGGGLANTAGFLAIVAGGDENTASGARSAIGGGAGNMASGDRAVVPGGALNTAAGRYSFAAGFRANANHDGAFVWGDATTADVSSTGANQFVLRANGGIRLPGAGENQPGNPAKQSGTNMFTHQIPSGGPCGTSGAFAQRTAIDHPLTNGKPDAILVITPNFGTNSVANGGGNPVFGNPVAVYYEDTGAGGCPAGKWVIYGITGTGAMLPNQKFNVLVINP